MNHSVVAEPEYRLIKQKGHDRYNSETTIQDLLKSRLSKKKVNNKIIDGMVSQ